MNLNGSRNHKGTMLFVNPRPAVEAAAKAVAPAPAKSASPATLAAPSGSLDVVLRTMSDGFAKLAAAVKGPAPAAPAPARSTMLASVERQARTAASVAEVAKAPQPDWSMPPCGMSVMPTTTQTQRDRGAEERAQARRAAQKEDADRVLAMRGVSRVKILRTLDPSLSDAALMALSYIVTKYEANERNPIPVNGPDLSRALDLPLVAAQAGYDELVRKKHVSSAKNSFGVTHVKPQLNAVGD